MNLNRPESAASSSEQDSSRRDAPILYISFDGMLEPLGRSQVLAYLYRLADSGFRFIILSLEREQDISAAAVSRLTHQLREHGIEWHWDRYRQGGIGNVAQNLFTSYRSALDLCEKRRVGLIHARAFLPALIARFINLTKHIPYLFDLRGQWVEERVAEGLWITNQAAYKIAKVVERNLIKHAQALVTLTAIHARDIAEKTHLDGQSVVVIPTCADYDVFAEQSASEVVPPDTFSDLRDKLVIGMVGSINKSYCIQEGFELFREIQHLRPDAHLLCLTRQTDEMQRLLLQSGIAEDSYTLRCVPHENVPAWMSLMDWALLLLKEGPAKRGSMPTKLAEYFAAGVRVAQFGCNAEVSEKVRASGCGIVLKDLSPSELKQAAKQIASPLDSDDDVEKARISTRDYFGVENGVRKYAHIYSTVLKKGTVLET